MKKLLSTAILLIYVFVTQAQNDYFQLKVRDAITHLKIQGVIVLFNNKVIGRTSKTGFLSIQQSLSKGDSLYILAHDYKNKKLAWSELKDQEVLYMSPAANLLQEITISLKETKKPTDPIEGMVWIPPSIYKRYYSLLCNDTINIVINGFWVDENEVTIAGFEKFVKSTGYNTIAERKGFSKVLSKDKRQKIIREKVNWRCDEWGDERPQKDYNLYPVIHIGWQDAMAYARWAGKRLLFEHEFDYLTYDRKTHHWHRNNSKISLKPIKQIKEDQFGIYDIIGNAQEFVCDVYNSGDWCSPLTTISKDSIFIVSLRGGSFFFDKAFNNSHNYWLQKKDHTSFMSGFRCAKDDL